MYFKYLNVGGGPFEHREDGWANLDYKFEASAYKRKKYWGNIDIEYNLMSGKPMPILSDSYDAVYSEHTIEHLTEDMVLYLFKEVYRILKPGGVFRVSCPDADWFYDSLVSPGKHKESISDVWSVRKPDASPEYRFLDALCSPLSGVLTDQDVQGMLTSMPKKVVFKALTSSVTTKEQADRPGEHNSCWNHLRLDKALTEAGFSTISQPLPPNESSCEAFKAGYIDTTVPICSIRIEAVK